MTNDTTLLVPPEQPKSYGTINASQSSRKQSPLQKPWWKFITGTGLVLLIIVMNHFFYHGNKDFPPVPDLIRVHPLSPDDTPDYATGRRLIVVGDIHGQLHSFQRLVAKVGYNQTRDRIVLLGDLITKGPHSLQVLDYAMSIKALCVRGNHASTVLELYAKLHKLPPYDIESSHSRVTDNIRIPPPLSNTDIDGHLFTNKKTKISDELVSRMLQPQHVEFMGTCPAILDLGPVGFNGTEAVAVHGGLQWNITSLEDQDPHVVFTIRSYAPPDYTEPLESADGKSWSIVWNEKQHEKPLAERLTVFYGHHSSNGLQIKDYSAGIDTACFGGGSLTAIIISQTESGELEHNFDSVSCGNN